MTIILKTEKGRLLSLFAVLLMLQVSVLIGSYFLLTKLPQPDSFSSGQLKVVAQEDDARARFHLTLGTKVDSQPVKLDSPLPDPTEVQVHKIARGDTLATIWTDLGAPYIGAVRAAQAFKKAGLSTGALRIGEELELRKTLAGDIVEFRRLLEDGRTFILRGNSDEGYDFEMLAPDVSEVQRTVVGTISSSFSAAAAEQNVPYQVVDEFVDLFSSRVEFRRSLQPGDTFTVNYIERRFKKNGQLLNTGEIETASLQTSGNLLVAIHHAGRDGRAHYFDESGNPLGNYFLRYPLHFSRISSAFSWARFHPILQITRPHYGVDFAAPIGTPVRSVADGVIVEAGYRGEAGIMLKIAHGKRYSTAYLHLSKVAAGLRVGSRVARGQVIGAVGQTGSATGPHLHFALYDHGAYVDPLKASLPNLSDGSERLPPAILATEMKALRNQHAAVALAELSQSKKNA